MASGLFGVGGGVLLTPIQYWLYTSGGMEGNLATRLAFGTSLAVVVPTMISGALAHNARNMVNWKAAAQMGVAAIFGGLTGGTLATHLPGNLLRVFFAVLIVMIAIRMVWHIHTSKDCKQQGSVCTHLLLGCCIGLISGLTGIGGGILLVPVLVIYLGYPIHQAIGTSSACLIFSSTGAVIAYAINGIGVANLPPFSIGYVDLLSFGLLVFTTAPLARLGVRYAYRCSCRNLQVFFAGLLILIGILMLLTSAAH
jgi:uncharacterized membrane protein YfcA